MIFAAALQLRWMLTEYKESDSNLYIPALDAIKDFIKTSTSSMTAVPKPLKFLRPHFEDLTKCYEAWPSGKEKVGRRNSPDFRLLC